MKYQVLMISEAENDLDGIWRYVSRTDSISKADKLLKNLEEKCFSLAQFPNRGHVPLELEKIAVYDYQKIHYKPYRIIYQVVNKNVYVHCVLDGRRDLQTILLQRLLK